MLGWRSPILIGALLTLPARMTAAADEKSAEKLLESKGLRRASSYFTLPAESEISKKLRAAESLKRKVFAAQEKLDEAKQAVAENRRLVLAYIQKRRQLRSQLPLARSAEQHNQIVMALNELADRVLLLQQSDHEEKALDEARTAAAAALEQYTEQLLELRRLCEGVERGYADLAADPAVAAAIDQFNKTASRSYRLGPSTALASNQRRLKRLEETVLSESIQLRRGPGGLWYVTATFNGQHPQEMAIDTGASVIALPWETAQAVGLTPGEDDLTVQVQMADGRVLEAKRVVANTVRVGKFTAEDVDCAVMPPGLPGAAPLLGLSFLKNFNFKIDSSAGQLVMSQLETSPSGARGRSTRSGQGAQTPKIEEPAQPPATIHAGQSGGLDDRARQLIQLLMPKTPQAGPEAAFQLQLRSGDPVAFQPCVQGPAATLRRRFGQPDTIRPLNVLGPAEAGDPAKPLQWELWIWGPVRLVVDQTGTTRFFAVLGQ